MTSATASVPAAERYLLDTSAVLTFTDQEEGFEKVEDLLDRAMSGDIEVVICAVTLMEVFYITLQEQGEDYAARLVALVKSWPVRWIYPDERTLLFAGRLKAFHRLSFADALIAGTAKLNESVLVHKDPMSWNHWIRQIHRWLSIVFTVTASPTLSHWRRGSLPPG